MRIARGNFDKENRAGLKPAIKNSDRKWIIVAGILLLLCVVRYFTKLTAYPSFYNDERFSYDVVTGFLNSGKLYQWDWATNSLSDIPYTRAWPYTILLSFWLRLFGTSLAAARAFGAFLGCFFILSYIYISKKWFNNLIISIAGSLLLLMNTEITFAFRYIRMYSLWMPLCLWTIHFLYRGSSERGRIRGRITELNYPLLAVGIALFFLSFEVHINTAAIALGVLVYIFVKALSTNEEIYKKLVGISILCITAFTLVFSLYNQGFLPETGDLVSVMCNRINKHIAPFKRINWSYLTTQLHYLGGYIITVLFLACGVIVCLKQKQYKKIFIYLCCIWIPNLFFFVFLTNRYYTSNYAIFLYVIIATFCACGLSMMTDRNRLKGFLAVICILAMCFGCNCASDYQKLYTSNDCCDYEGGFAVLNETLSDNDTGVIQNNLYKKHLHEGLMNNHSELSLYNLNENKYDAFPYDDLLSFARICPQGILLCEERKYRTTAHPLWRTLISEWTDPICRPDMDPYNFYISRYHFVFPDQVDCGDSQMDYSYNEGAVGWKWLRNRYVMRVFIRKDAFGDNPMFTSIEVKRGHDLTYYQMVTDGFMPNEDGYYVYEIQFPYTSSYVPSITDYHPFHR